LFEHRRLTECYTKSIKNKDVIEITDETKLVFFSDVHRGDNSMSDEFAHNQNVYIYALEQYFNEGFTYLEVGDGDELWEYSKFAHIRSAHSDVFCLLKKYHDTNRFYYFFGNHNMAFRHEHFAKHALNHFYDEYLDIDTPLFPGLAIKESMILRDVKSQKELLVVHGHQGDVMNDQGWVISLFLMRVFWRYMHMVGFQNPSSPSQNRVKRHKIEKTFSKWIRLNQTGILCGHTHRPKLPEEGEATYLNTGCCVHPRGITGIELVNRQFYLVHWSIRPDEKGRLSIMKKIMKGPLSFDEIKL
jgi:UDP-2,3-diacylglucosamine pyrophosphatase LpxH